MKLSSAAARCLEAMEAAGYSCYAVGGCVRDSLLGLSPHDFDLCTNAKPEEIQAVFDEFPLVLAGIKHGTVGVVTEGTVVEITTFRVDGGYADARHPSWVAFVPDLTADLSRRDFTVNAMAYHPKAGLTDPFGGQKDLENKVLRCVGDPARRFQEDALRILRGVRFAVRFGLRPEKATLEAMLDLRANLDQLSAERVFSELCGILPRINAQKLEDFAPIFVQVLPELAPLRGYDQRTPYHKFDLFTHTAKVLEAVGPELPLRWAALLHDIGKPATQTLEPEGAAHYYGHAQVSAELAKGILTRLKAPKALGEQVDFLIRHHMDLLTADEKLLRRRLSRWGAPKLQQLLELEKADIFATGVEENRPDFEEIQEILKKIQEESPCFSLKDLAVNGRDLLALGLRGPEIGKALEFLLSQVVDQALPNEKEALLAALTQK